MNHSDSSYVALEIIKLDTDEVTKEALIKLLELERENLHQDRFMSRAEYKAIISEAAAKWEE